MSESKITESATINSSTVVTLEDIGFTSEQVKRATRAFITPSDGKLRYLDTGEVPMASFGHLLPEGDTYDADANVDLDLENLQLIAESVNVNVTIGLVTFA